MLVTKAQAREALRRAREIADGDEPAILYPNFRAARGIGWLEDDCRFGSFRRCRNHVLLCLVWIATIGGALDEK